MKQATKYKARPKNQESYLRTIVFKYEPTFEEREGIVRRCIYREQEDKSNKNLSWIVVEKTMEKVVIKFTRKLTRKKKCAE